MQTQELGNAIVRLCEERQGIEAVSRFYANDVISNEAPGPAVELRSEGKASVLAKNQWWYENHEIHELTARGPLSPARTISLRFSSRSMLRSVARVSAYG